MFSYLFNIYSNIIWWISPSIDELRLDNVQELEPVLNNKLEPVLNNKLEPMLNNVQELEPTLNNKINNNTYYRNSISCPNNLYSQNKCKIKVSKPLVINLDLRCDNCKRLIMKDKSIYCFNDKIFCLDICRAKYIKY